jgi:hypothetical protein
MIKLVWGNTTYGIYEGHNLTWKHYIYNILPCLEDSEKSQIKGI